VPAPPCRLCCGGRLVKRGEDMSETLDVVPRTSTAIHTVREKLTPACAGQTLAVVRPDHPAARTVSRYRPGVDRGDKKFRLNQRSLKARLWQRQTQKPVNSWL
jgi:hypothetical protein